MQRTPEGVAEHIDRMREAYGLSIAELARRASVDRTNLWYVLTQGRYASPGIIGPVLEALGNIVSERAT